MKLLTTTLLTIASFGALAATDNEVCQQYGSALSNNDTQLQISLMSEMLQRSSDQSWSLTAQQCQALISEAKVAADFELADSTNND